MNELWQHLSELGWTRTAILSASLSRADIARYAGSSGDVNLVHVDEPFSRAAGHAGVLAHGMLTMGLTGSFVTSLVGHHHLRYFGGRFVAPVVAGDALTCTATLSSVRPDDGGVTAGLDLRTTTNNGTEVFLGAALAFKPNEEER